MWLNIECVQLNELHLQLIYFNGAKVVYIFELNKLFVEF